MEKTIVWDHELFRERLNMITGGESQVSISAKTGIPKSKLNHILNGKSSSKSITTPQRPSTDDLLAIASAYDCSIDDLLGVSDQSQARTRKQISFRDACEMIVQIDRALHIIADRDEKMTKGGSIRSDHPLVKMSFDLALCEREMNTNFFFSPGYNNGKYSECYVAVNEFLDTYFLLKERTGIKKDSSSFEQIINSLLLNVPDYVAPYMDDVPETIPDERPEDPNAEIAMLDNPKPKKKTKK